MSEKSTEFGGWSLSDVVEGRYFRVPDYQRGYAWTNRQLDEFWDDLNAVVESGGRHYTGAITVKAFSSSAESVSYEGFEVVDGQQRLTTIAILLSVLKGFDNPFVFNEQGCSHYVFSYGERNNDLQFLLKILSGDELGDALNSHQRNLKNAQEFFKVKTSDFDEESKNKIVDALMSQLSFDFRDIGSNYSAGMVFETMNNRGKPLTLLEKLKNRLMYLVETLHQDVDENPIDSFKDEKSELRDHIDYTWGRIYRLLAKNPKSDPLDEDVFIAAHLSVYRAPKESVYSRTVAESRLFKMFCHNAERHPKSERIEESVADAVARAVKEEAVSVEKIRDYVEDLAEFAEAWSGIHEAYDSALARCRLLSGTQEVKVFLATVLLHVKDETLCNSICEKAELILFRNTVRSVMDEATFATLARRLHGRCLAMLKKGDNEQIDAQGVESVLREILEDERRQLNVKSVVDYFSDLMSRQQSPYGFYGWRGLKYFLFRQEGPDGLAWNRFDEATLEHVMPQSATADNDDGWWVRQMAQFVAGIGYGNWDSLSSIDRRTCRQCKRNLVNSIGNFVLLTQSENASVSDAPWEEYPEVAGSHKNVIGKKAFYSDPDRISSFGARRIAEIGGSWNAFRIRERGRDLFKNLVADLGAVGSIDDEDVDVALGFAAAPSLENHQFEALSEDDVNRLAPRLETAAEERLEAPKGAVNEANVAFWTEFKRWCKANNKTWCVGSINERGDSYYSPSREYPLFFTFGKRSGSIKGCGSLVTVGIYCAEGEEQRNKIRAFKDAFDKAFVDSAFDHQDWEYGNGKARRILFIRQADYINYTSDLFERMANDYERILGVMHENGF